MYKHRLLILTAKIITFSQSVYADEADHAPNQLA